MKIRLLTRRYAQAFLDNIDEKDYDSLLKDITNLSNFISENPKIVKILQSLALPRKTRLLFLESLFEECESCGLSLYMKKYWHGLLVLLIRKHRIPLLREILNETELLLLSKQGKAKLDITFARKHETALRDQIIEYAGKFSNKKLIPHTYVKPAIIGGFVAEIGSLKIDGSIVHNLDKFKKVNK